MAKLNHVSYVYRCLACPAQLRTEVVLEDIMPPEGSEGWQQLNIELPQFFKTGWLCPTCARTPEESVAFIVLANPGWKVTLV